MKLDHEEHFTGYVYIKNCKISAVLNPLLIERYKFLENFKKKRRNEPKN
jgi:hypothetical protein